MNIQQKLSDILKLNLPRKWTSVSYAIMVDGKLVAADALGQDGTKDKNPVTLNHTYNVCSISKIFCTVAVMKLVEQGKVDLIAQSVNICLNLPCLTHVTARSQCVTA